MEEKDTANKQKTRKSRYFRFLNDLTDYYENTCVKISEDIAQDAIIYGIDCNRIKNNTSNSGYFYIADDSQEYLCFAVEKSEKILRIQLNNINNIEFSDCTKNLKKYKKSEGEKFMQILLNFTLYDFSFSSLEKMSTFIKGLLLIIEQIRKNFKNKASIVDLNINRLTSKHDQNCNEIYEGNEFKNLAKDIGINHKELIKCIDKDGDGQITKEELMEYLNNKAYGNQFINIFNKYSSFKTINENNDTDYSYEYEYGENTMSPAELQIFFIKEQNENISMLEAYQIVCLFLPKITIDTKIKLQKKIQKSYIKNNYKINKNDINLIMQKLNKKIKNGKIEIEDSEYKDDIRLELSLKTFTNMMYSHLLSIFDKKKLFTEIDESHPLVDYIINSTHNTYLKGHQFTGESSTDTYEYAVLNGHRLIELDCYNGDGDKIRITHGYTLANSIFLEDILKVLKKNSFKKSNLPVILSIENHLDKKHQEIMAKNLKDILQDLYIFPNEKKPDFIPNLKDLENKFIIKCGGKRLWQNENIDTKKINTINTISYTENKLKKIIIKQEDYENMEDSSDDDEEIADENKPNIQTIYNIDLRKSENEKFFTSISNNTISSKSFITGSTAVTSPLQNSINKNVEFFYITKNIFEEEPSEEEFLNPKEEEICALSLEKIRGLCGVKLKYQKINEMKYQKWEFVTLKSTQYLKSFNIEKVRKEFIKLSNFIMMKAYPQNMDSTNYDIIKCWACGCQVAAINIQSMKDDFTLFNKVFFMQNKNCGYVLKPEKLFLNNNEYENYNNPVAFFKLKILFIFNLSNLLELSKIEREENGKVTLDIYPLDNYENIKKINMKLDDGLLFPTIKNNENFIKMPVYEKDLGGVMIKFYYEGKMFARACIPYCMMKNGYRKVSLFCNDCVKREGSFIIGEFRLIDNNKSD